MNRILSLVLILSPLQLLAQRGDVESAVNRGVKWLLEQQGGDGAFRSSGVIERTREHHAAVHSALVLLALHDAGHLAAGRSEESRAMVRAVRFLMGEKDQGIVPGGFYFGRIDRSRMYGQGIITFGLASAVVDLEDKDLRSLCIERLIDAKDLILRAQDTTKQPGHDGGWRYEPQSKDSDLSITAWQLLALKTMVDQLGVTVPSTTWSRACSYVIGTGSAVPGKAEFTFGYDGKGGQIRFSGNASALVSLQCCGAGNTDEARGGISFMDTHFPAADERWFYYGIAHATRAFRSAGDADLLGRYAQRLKDVLLPRQQADGSWKSEEGHEKPLGSLFSTAMAVSALAPMLTHIQETRETR